MLRIRQFHGACLRIPLEPSASPWLTALPLALVAAVSAWATAFPSCFSVVIVKLSCCVLRSLPVAPFALGSVPAVPTPVRHWGPGGPTRLGRLLRGWIGRSGRSA